LVIINEGDTKKAVHKPSLPPVREILRRPTEFDTERSVDASEKLETGSQRAILKMVPIIHEKKQNFLDGPACLPREGPGCAIT
jgi:hypothetical protein